MQNSKKEIVRLVLAGQIQSSIARKLGISRQRVNQIVKELGLKPEKNTGKIPKDIDIERYTVKEVAQKYNVGTNNVYLFAKRRGRKFRSARRS